MHKRMLAMVPVLALLAACGSVTGPTSYPASWAPLAAGGIGDRCPDLNGAYANVASAAHPALGDPAPKLTAVFGRMERSQAITASGIPWDVPPDAEWVEIAQDDQQLTVTFHGAPGGARHLRFRRLRLDLQERRFDDLFTCYRDANGARLRFMQDVDPRITMLRGAYMGANVGLVFLLKAVDGSLVVQFRTEDIGVSALVIGTHASFDSAWWRYPPAAAKE